MLNLADLNRSNRTQIRRAGARYTPGLDPDAPNIQIEEVTECLAFLSTEDAYRNKIRALKDDLEESQRWAPSRLDRAFRNHRNRPTDVAAALDRLANARPGEYEGPTRDLRRSTRAVQRTLSKLDHQLIRDRANAGTKDSVARQIQSDRAELGRVADCVRAVQRLIDSPAFSLLSNNAMLLLGDWGTGKTHSLCDLAQNRMNAGAPTLFFLAQNLPIATDPLQGLCHATQLASAPEELLSGLEELGRAAGARALLVIDAINEGDRASWSRYLTSIVSAIHRLTHVGLVLSCRRPFETLILSDRLRRRFVAVEHHGFTDAEVDAQLAFFTHYDIPAPHFPLLTPEFSRPLFLKLLCESVHSRVLRHRSRYLREIASGQKGMTLVIEDFAKKVGRPIERSFGLPPATCWRLLKGDRIDGSATRLGIAPTMARVDRDYLFRDECLSIIQMFTPLSAPQGEELMHRLLADGLLAEGITWTDDGPVAVIQFPYQRFGDHLVARYLLDQHLRVDSERTIRRAFYANRPLGRVFELRAGGASYHRPGLASAIMLEFPERVKRSPLAIDERELVSYLPRSRQLAAPLRDVFLEGLYWRPNDSFCEQTDRIMNFYLTHSNDWSKRSVFEVLFGLATRAEHPYSATRLAGYLREFTVADRDTSWSEFVRSSYRESVVYRLVEWIERIETVSLDAPVARNCIILLSLVLTTTRRRLRDRATRALYRLGLAQPKILFEQTIDSLNWNDPYIPERMLAASYGVAMSMWADPRGAELRSVMPSFAQRLVARMFVENGEHRTSHILMQDYALGAIELARRIAPNCVAQSQQTYLRRPLRGVRSGFPSPDRILAAQIEAAKPAMMMDFENYTLGRLVSDRGNYQYDHTEYQNVRRQVLWRIANLGYSRERFGSIDRAIAYETQFRDTDPAKTDRYGKKYSWIAFFEMYGVQCDAGRLGETRDDRPSDADIDPSFPAGPHDWSPPTQGVFHATPAEPAKWLASGVSPNYEPLLAPAEVDGMSGPWVLLDGWIEEKAPRDKRRIFTFLRTRFVPRTTDLGTLVGAFRDWDYPGNSAIPDPGEDFYTYAGEVPWSHRFGSHLRLPGGTAFAYVEPAFARYPSFGEAGGWPVEVPIVRWSWESYHSSVNQAAPVYYPAPALCDALGLVNHAGSMDLYDKHGRRATVSTKSGGRGDDIESHLLFIRQELLAKYLRAGRKRWLCFVWGERDIKVGGIGAEQEWLKERESLADLYQGHRNIHREAYLWDIAGRSRRVSVA